jgi:hypothetical protein
MHKAEIFLYTQKKETNFKTYKYDLRKKSNEAKALKMRISSFLLSFPILQRLILTIPNFYCFELLLHILNNVYTSK